MLRLTRHARNRLRSWRLNESAVSDTVVTPDHVSPTRENRLNAWKRLGEHWLRVTYMLDGSDIVASIVTLRRRGP